MKKIKDARKQYEYLRNKLMKEFKRGGLTTQEEKIFKIVEAKPSALSDVEIKANVVKAKAKFKQARATKKYKVERSLRNKFYKALGKLYEEELSREARRRILNLPPSPDQLRASYFQIMQYQKILKEGITRRQGGRVVRFKGLEGIKVQIKSFEFATDSYRKKNQFINTYIENMQNMGVPSSYETIDPKTGKPITVNLIQEINNLLESFEPNQITYLLDTGKLYDIKFYYVLDESDLDDLYQMIQFLTDNREAILNDYNATIENENQMKALIRQERRYKKRTEVKINKNY